MSGLSRKPNSERRKSEVSVVLDRQQEDGSLVFAVRVVGHGARPYSPQEVALRLCASWEAESRRVLNDPRIRVELVPAAEVEKQEPVLAGREEG